MISISGKLPAIVECIYLKDELRVTDGTSDIIVNPQKLKYLTGKTVIINTIDYPLENINQLISNNCKIISRINLNDDRIIFQPYIMRICYDVMWNGDILDKYPPEVSVDSILSGESDFCRLKLPDYKLFFPKIKKVNWDYCKDSYGNITWLGWILHQVGVNVKDDTEFKDLDVVKTGKILL